MKSSDVRSLPVVAVLFWTCAGPALSASLPSPPALSVLARSAQALPGSEFAARVSGLPLAERETRIITEITSGNIPDFLRAFVPVTVTDIASGRTNTVTFFASPDYLAVGSSDDYLLTPMRPETAQRIADKLDCILPTPKMVDAVYQAAAVKLPPSPLPPSPAMTTVPVFSNHNSIVGEQLKRSRPTSHRDASPLLVAGHKKDIVITHRLSAAPGKVAIYGWHRTNGIPVQSLYLGHTADWVDYSQCVRLIHRDALVNGRSIPIPDLLKNPVLAPLLSDEGPIPQARYGK